MLINVDLLHHLPPQRQTQTRPTVEPIRIVCARSIAHMDMSPVYRAELAAAWIKGHSLVRPTVKLAGEVFGVSYPLIANALTTGFSSVSSMPLGMLAYGWLESSSHERAAFCAEYEADIWHSLEHVTDQS